jgi:glycogen debranching enzyme
LFTTILLIRAGKLGLLAGITACVSLPATISFCQQIAAKDQAGSSLALDTDAVGPSRFIVAHGRRAMIGGYAAGGLEIWVYPFQVLSNYQVAFRASATTTPIPGQDILGRITYEPDSITRTYLGADFVVREKLFVPLDKPGAIFTYKVESDHPVEIEVHATPVLNLMWPGALGGQSTVWSPSLSAFVLSEPAEGYSAVVGSPEIVAKDDIFNRAVGSGGDSAGLGFTLHPDSAGVARVYVALNPPHAKDPGTLFRQLIRDRPAEEVKATGYLREFLDSVLHVETPDPKVNQAITWAEIALDQAWVCNPKLGCGFVAGYGPSRGARRPQYDWFFAGDGLVAAESSILMSDYTRTREELEFILRYQDPRTGMIWHELSQSAGLIDWAGKFPYMFVHVDITFQFLTTIEHYVTASGDAAFATEHWNAIESAYRYCRSLIDPASGLPRIPSDKEGGDEQDRTSDDLGLSASWVQAASAFAQLATLTGHPGLANEAARSSHLAAAAIPNCYWSAKQSFWVSGHSASGQNEPEQRSAPSEALTMHLFNPEQNASLLDQLASSSFQTDWGTRGVGALSPGFDPGSYAKGSVWAVGTASLATAFWSEHRPVTALALWNSLLPWASLDSLGHMHEVLAGNFYRPQVESVPEQTWSSAGFLDATIHGLLGLDVDSAANRITFTPRLPTAWNSVSLEHVKLSNSSIALRVRRTPRGLNLEIDNAGSPCKISFAPQIPLGARVGRAELNHHRVTAVMETHPQETDVRIRFDAPHGGSELSIDVQGGVSVIADSATPLLGMPSAGIHVIGTSLAGNTLTIVADVPSDRESHIQLQTEWRVAGVTGAALQRGADGLVGLAFAASPDASVIAPYHRVTASVELKTRP